MAAADVKKLNGKTDEDAVRLARALGHPLRLKIMNALNREPASPSELAAEWGLEVAGLAYHCRVLEKADCVELVKTEAVRGSVKHTFKATQRTLIDAVAWAKVAPGDRGQLTIEFVNQLQRRIEKALNSDTFDSRTDRCIDASTFEVDEEAWQKICESIEDLSLSLIDIQAEAAERARNGEDDRFWATVSLMSFESPGPE